MTDYSKRAFGSRSAKTRTSARSLRARSLLLEPAIMDTMKLSHLYEKFMVAVEVLATSPASLQRRLDVTEAGCEVIGSVDEGKLCLWACATIPAQRRPSWLEDRIYADGRYFVAWLAQY